MLKTGELSKVFEIDRTSLNHYVKMGLLNPEVQENQYYQYSFEDVLALSYIRYYRGLGFGINQIKYLTKEAEHEEKLFLFEEKLDEIEKEIRFLRMKQRFLEHLKNSVQFYKDYRNQCVVAKTEGYYFIRKEDITDPGLKELYKMIPSSEFEVKFDAEYQVTIESLKSTQGLALKEEWIQDFQLEIPDEAVYYPPEMKCLCSWRINNNQVNEQIRTRLIEVIRQCREMGYKVSANFVVYVLINHYHTDQESFDVFAQFSLKPID